MTAPTNRSRIVFIFIALAMTLAVTTGLLNALAITAHAPETPGVDVGGVIDSDTTWTQADSPYVLTETVTVAVSVTLTIEPGVVVMGQTDTSLVVNGHLEAIGTVTEPITFTSAADTGPGEWHGIAFGGTGYLNHAIVRYAGQASVESVIIDGQSSDGLVTIENSVIQNNFGYPLMVRPDDLHRFQMSNVSFANNAQNRVIIGGDPWSNIELTENVTLSGQHGLEGYEIVDFVIIVPAGITMTLQPSTTIMATDSGYCPISVAEGGHLEAVGTAVSPVTFTSTSDSSPGEWTSICVGGSAHFDYAKFRYSMFNLDIWGSTGGEVFIENSVILSSSQYGLWTYPDSIHRLRMSNVVFGGNARNRVLIDLGYDVYELAEDTSLTSQPGLEGYELNAPFQTTFTPILRIPAGITLTMEPGTTLMAPTTVNAGGTIAVLEQGHLEAQGTADLPITFTSSADSGPGEWSVLAIVGSANLDHVIVRNGEFGINFWGEDDSHVYISNSVLSNSSEYPLWVDPNVLHRLHMSNVTFLENARNRVLIETWVDNKSLAGNATLTPQPGLEGYVIQSWNDPSPQLVIPTGLTLTIAPSVTVMMLEDTAINVNGHLVAEGTAVSPITFTSITDTLPGQWSGLIVSGTAVLNHAHIRYGQDNLSVLENGQVDMHHSEISQASVNGVSVDGGSVTAVCSTFISNTGDAVHVTSSGTPDVQIFGSTIMGNGSGVNNLGGTAVDALSNWWGDPTGPGGDGPGSGDAVWGSVLYDPWLTEPAACDYQLFLPIVLGE